MRYRALITLCLFLCALAPALAGFPSRGSHVTAAAAYVGPCDAGVGTFKVFYGVRKCATAYASNAMSLKRTSDNATCTLTYASNGLLDVVSHLCSSNTVSATTFCNATTCTITQFNDTSGALACSGSTACSYSPTTSASITLQFNCTGSIPCIQTTASTGTASLTWTASSTQPYTGTTVANRISTSGASSIFQTGAGATLNFNYNAAANAYGMFAGTASELTTPTDGTFNAMTGVVNGASSTWKLNGAAPATVAATPGSNASGTANVRVMVGVASTTVQIMEFGFMNGAMSTGNQTTLYTNQSAFYGSVF